MRAGQLIKFYGSPFAVRPADNELGLPPGNEICGIIKDLLRSTGIVCSEEFPRAFYGWEFTATFKKRRYFLVFQTGCDCSLAISQIGFINFLYGESSESKTIDELSSLIMGEVKKKWPSIESSKETAFFEFSI